MDGRQPVQGASPKDPVGASDPIRRVVATILREAVAAGATELVFEPIAEGVIVSYSVHRVIHDIAPLPRSMATPMAEFVRKMAGLPPGGSISGEQGEMWVRTNNQDYHLIVIVTPVRFGERITIRLPA